MSLKFEQGVCNKDLAKRIKELGVKQDSLWAWERFNTGEDDLSLQMGSKNQSENEYYSAFTVAELGELLEHYTSYIHFMPNWKYHSWKVQLENKEIARTYTEADARAKMLIYLLEEGYVKQKRTNKQTEKKKKKKTSEE